MDQNKDILGIDIGDVIKDNRGRLPDQDYLHIPVVRGAFEAIKRLVNERFGSGNVFIVSKCALEAEESLKVWLRHHSFYELTGVKEDHVHFCRKRHEKAPICERLGITHFIDDRLEVLSYIALINPSPKDLFLFRPQRDETEQFIAFFERMIPVESWQEILEKLLPGRNNVVSVDYSKLHVKDFEHWGLYVHENQSYLGRCYLWCKRDDVRDLPNASDEEWNELLYLLRMIERVIWSIFKPDMLNYSFLGNVTHHLHGHIIPRYARPVEFEGMMFEDKLWGNNYQADKNFVTPPGVLEAVIKKFKQAFD